MRCLARDRCGRCAGRKVRHGLDNRGCKGQEPAKRDVFPERDKMELVIGAGDSAGGGKKESPVVVTGR